MAGWPKQKAGLAGQAGLCWRSPVRVGGLWGREGATQQPKRIFCYEMYFKHDLPHDEGYIWKKIWLKKFMNAMFIYFRF